MSSSNNAQSSLVKPSINSTICGTSRSSNICGSCSNIFNKFYLAKKAKSHLHASVYLPKSKAIVLELFFLPYSLH